MANAAITLNYLVSFLLLMMAFKYLFGPVPAKYHVEILDALGIENDDPHKLLFGAINPIFGFTLISLSSGIATITYFGVANDLLWAKYLIAFMGISAGLPITIVASKMESRTGVRTPWRPAAALTAVIASAFCLSLL